MFRKIIMAAVLAGTLGGLLGGAPASASTAHTARTVPCLNQPFAAQKAEVWWQTRWKLNPGVCIQRGAGKCHGNFGQKDVWANGGWVEPAGKWSRGTCPTGWVLVQGNFDWSGNGGTTYYYCEVWPKYTCTGTRRHLA
jgi:hypothetical protein